MVNMLMMIRYYSMRIKTIKRNTSNILMKADEAYASYCTTRLLGYRALLLDKNMTNVNVCGDQLLITL